MPSSRIPSPARSQGVRSTPRRYNPRTSRSVGSPARSNTSVKLSALIQMDTFALSPMPARRSVLTDTSEIDVPTRKSWWKKLNENSREIMDVINTKGPSEGNIAIEEYIEIDVLSQEKQKKNYTLDLPESSDGESISSIVIPQRKLFTQKESKPQQKFGQIIDNRESLAKLNKTQGDEKIVNVGRKDLFNQGTKLRNKPIFPSALLNVSPNKAAENKTKEPITGSVKGQVKTLFGNCGGIKRKNMFADFIVSESEDEIPEIQSKVHKKIFERRQSLKSKDAREGNLGSPTCNLTDIEMDDWRLLPSSTMVDHQLEDGLGTTPSKKARLSKLLEAKESFNTGRNKTTNRSKTTDKTLNSKNKSKNLSKLKNTANNESIIVAIEDNVSNKTSDHKNKKNKTSDRVDKTLKDTSHDRSLKKVTPKNKLHDKSKTANLNKTGKKIVSEADSHFEDKNSSKQHKQNKSKDVKKHSINNQMLQSDDEDFTLVYENDDQDSNNEINNPETLCEKEPEKSINISNVLVTTESVKHNKSKSQNFINQNDDEKDGKSVCLGNENENVFENVQTETSEKYNRSKSQLDLDDKDNHQNQITGQADVEDEQDNKELVQENIEEEIINEEEEEELINHQEKEKKKRDVEMEEMEVSENYLQKDDDNNTENNKYINKADEIKTQNKTSKLNKSQGRDEHDSNQTGEKTKHLETSQVNIEVGQNEVINEIISYEKKDETQDTCDKKNKTNKTATHVETTEKRVSTDRSKYIQDKVPSPEACRQHNKTSQMESFTVEGRNTSARKTKSDFKNHTIRPSLAPVRQSTGLSDATQNSSSEGSGWDSHRTTRATLRQTFGKDFTLRKSLRALVMEKSAKRQTNVIEMNADISRFPQANSTELPISEQLVLGEEDIAQKMNTFDNLVSPESRNTSYHELSNELKSLNGEKTCESDGEHKSNDSNVEGPDEIDESEKEQNNSHIVDGESDNAEESNESNNEVSLDVDEADDDQEIELDDDQEMKESDHEVSRHDDDADNSQEVNESDDAQEINESDQEVSHDIDVADDVQENNDSEEAQELIESGHEVSRDIDDADDDQENNVPEDGQEPVESGNEVSCDNDAYEQQENNESEDAQELNESDHEVSADINDGDDAQKSYESDNDAQDKMESDNEMSSDNDESNNAQDHDTQDRRESDNDVSDDNEEHDNAQSHDIQDRVDSYNEVSDNNNEESEFINIEDGNDVEYSHAIDETDHETSQSKTKVVQKKTPDRGESRNVNQTTLEMYLQKVKSRKLERKKQLVDDIMNTLKAPARDILNPFKVPAVPKLRRMRAQQTKPKARPLKQSMFTTDMLPPEILEDMKYKPPKRYRPANASWITNRLYKFLESKLQPKYDYKARVRSEKLVETIYNFTKDIRRQTTAPAEAVDALKLEMARLDVVKTHVEFYEFFHEYMPREVRVKVVPDLFNKISLPKRGVFSDIIR